ncbi:hypothetical protein [Marinobacter sp.]|uniref:hypothetical protein n=1 Tax=Marinobacter sp. TaxID=50741 RepID=UPI0025BA3FD8|nr:hypothetical protein [Marinobacter sp.]
MLKNSPKRSIKTTLGVMASAVLLTVLPATSSMAEQTRVPVMSQADRAAVGDLPQTGQSKAQVRERFGSPGQIEAPVGQPPITRWHYAEFIVYFEQGRVIHTVVKPR